MRSTAFCLILFIAVTLGRLGSPAVALAGEPPEWVRGQKTFMEEELKALEAHAAKVSGGLKRAEQVVELAVSIGDSAAAAVGPATPPPAPTLLRS